jgi:hypothetical protein
MIGPWSQWLDTAATAPGDRVAMIEFVANDAAEQFLADAEVLKRLITECENGESANPGFSAFVIR